MRKIFKYVIKVTDDQTVVMPAGAEILTVQEQAGNICMWAIVTEGQTPQPRRIEVFGTGHPIPSGRRNYLGTVQTDFGSLVWHIFERV